jgi:hypothetical protein
LFNYWYNETKHVNAENIMHRKSKTLFTLTGLAFVATLSFSQFSLNDRNVFCGSEENIVLDQELPISHPENRCATSQSQGVSWSAWFSGRSSSYQFHFIDLLELLSRTRNNETKNPTTAN